MPTDERMYDYGRLATETDMANTMNRRTLISSFLMGGASLVLGGPAYAYAVTRTDAEWKAMLPAESYTVLRHEGTEYAFSSPLDKNFKKGTYACMGCDLTNFS